MYSSKRADFLDRVFTSRLPEQAPIRFAFEDGEVGALYTLSRDPATGEPCPVVLYIATFPPSIPRPGLHDFGIDYWEQPVATAREAAEILARFDRAEAARIRNEAARIRARA